MEWLGVIADMGLTEKLKQDLKKALEIKRMKEETEKKEQGALGGIGGGLAKLLKVVEPEIRISPRLLERDSRTVLDLGLQLSVNLPGDLDSILVGAVLAARSQLSGK